LFLKNNGVVTPEMSVLGDKIKSTIREILLIQEAQEINIKNPNDLETHLYAG
tara:strand:- start:92 stop:247 length:156 start_codon:yes stop_codon:yes gene_type:complete